MTNYSIYLPTDTEKYDCIRAIQDAGAKLTGVSGCGAGYYIQIDATPDQAEYIDRTRYTAEIDAYSTQEAWAAWKAGRLTVGQLATWQARHSIFFDSTGAEVTP